MWRKIKETAFELVQWAEKELAGKTGKEKRAAVVRKMCELLNVPYVPEWLEGMFEPILYAWIVDRVCNVMNILTNHDMASVTLTPEQVTKAAGLIAVTQAGEEVLPNEACLPDKIVDVLTRPEPDLDARLTALCEEYGVAGT
jgi:hypothetical protein